MCVCWLPRPSPSGGGHAIFGHLPDRIIRGVLDVAQRLHEERGNREAAAATADAGRRLSFEPGERHGGTGSARLPARPHSSGAASSTVPAASSWDGTRLRFPPTEASTSRVVCSTSCWFSHARSTGGDYPSPSDDDFAAERRDATQPESDPDEQALIQQASTVDDEPLDEETANGDNRLQLVMPLGTDGLPLSFT